MPGIPRVGFAAEPTVSRPPNHDEEAVLHNFALHASHCRRCANPYETHLAGKTLCDRGRQHARRVARYLYNKGGKACSTLHVEGLQSVQVEIPIGYEPVRGLLKAMERGLRLHARNHETASPIVSQDRTYPIAPRPATRNERPRIEIVEPPTTSYDPAEKGMYASDYEYSYHGRPHPTSRRPVYEDDIVFYAAPRSYRSRRSSLYQDEAFYR
ncbi:MAG: hypothetical protein M1837_005465 [Sclerophora amabilis]|nr:MAG: hypothetical protein M1837_005465 [Sclerophora amabilis]